MLQRLVKQRKDSAAIYVQQGRQDLAEPELLQSAVIEKFLPKQLSENEVEVAVVPGEAFGTPGYIRLSYALGDDDLIEGISRVQDLLK